MNKLFLIFFTFLMLISSTFAFDILGSNNLNKTYFTLADSTVKVQTTNNVSNYSVSYVNGNVTKISNYNLISCNNTSKCSSFLISDFLSNNGLVLANTNLTITLNNVSKNIYLDIVKPDFTFISSNVVESTMKVDLVFSYSDNYGVSKIDLYKKEGLNSVFVKTLTGLNNYSLDIISAGLLELEFKVYDLAGNYNVFAQNINIPDLTKPKILSSKLTLQEGKYQLYFTLSDENLSRYEISQGSLKLSGDISGTSYANTVNLPFDSGSIEFRVYDGIGNVGIKTISLTSPFTNTYGGKYSNLKTFKFTSNANSCKLISIGSSSDSRDFVKSENIFSIDLSITSVMNYPVKFYCENSDFKEVLSYDFYYDVNKPSNSTLEIEKLDDGDLKLSWGEATDTESDVRYVLYEGGDEIYSGTKLKYTDSNVKYPKTYTYELKILDDAGNFVISNEVSEVPKKVNIEFISNLLKEQTVQKNVFNLEFETDIDSKVLIIVKNNLKELFKKEVLTDSNNKIYESINLSKGVNEVIVKVSDNFDNVKEESFFVTYSPIVLAEPEKTIVQQLEEKPTVITPVFVPEPTVYEEFADSGVEEVSSPYFWLWFILWFVLFGLFIYFIFFRKELILGLIKNSSKRRSDGLGFSVGRRKDVLLGRNLSSIKQKRIERQNEREMERRRNEVQKQRMVHRSEIERKKHEDLSRPRTTALSFGARKRLKKNYNKLMKSHELRDEILKTKSKGRDVITYIKDLFKKKTSGIEKEDSISQYLASKVGNKSWKSSADYVKKDEVKVVEKVPVKEEIVEKSIPQNFNKVSLDDYLSKRTKKKRFLFAEKQVESDIEAFSRK